MSKKIITTQQTTYSFPALLRVIPRAKPLSELLAEAIDEGMPIVLLDDTPRGENEEASAIDPTLAVEAAPKPPPPPQPGTSYAGLTPAQRHAFLSWCHQPQEPAPLAFQQLYLANLEARLLETTYRQSAREKLLELATAPSFADNPGLDRAYLLDCWLHQDGQRLAGWISTRALRPELLGIALGLQAMIGEPLTPAELGKTIATWQVGASLPADLLKMRLDSLTSILGAPPLAYALSQLDAAATAPRPWRSAHRGLRLLIPQPDLRPVLEPSLADLLAVADVVGEEPQQSGLLPQPPNAALQQEDDQPSLEDLGWRLILEFGSNRSEYFNYVLLQAQKLPGYSQLMDEDRRIVYRIIFRKSEMRRFWRLWDYVHGWTSTRVYLNGQELEKWKVWPYSQYLR